MGPEIMLALLVGALLCVLLTGFPVAFVLGGVSVVVAYVGIWFGVLDERILGGVHQQVFGIMGNRTMLAIPLFTLMGLILERSQVAEQLLTTMGRLFGSMRGGLAVSVCVVGALLAASTGIVGATVVTMGLLSLPAMMRAGYSPSLATGTICASGTLGQIIPPSMVLIILGDQMQAAYDKATRDPAFACERVSQWSPCENLHSVSVSELFAGAFLPGVMLVGMYIAYVLLVAWLRPVAAPAARDRGETDPDLLSDVFRSLMPPLMLILAVLGSILLGVATPTEAAAIGAVIAILIAAAKTGGRGSVRMAIAGIVAFAVIIAIVLIGQVSGLYQLRPTRSDTTALEWGLIALVFCLIGVFALSVLASTWSLGRQRTTREGKGPSILWQALVGTMKISCMIFVILIGARALTTVFIGFGGDALVKQFLLAMPGGIETQLVVVLGVMFLLGFFLDFIEISFIVVPIVAPILLLSGIHPVWLGVLFAMNLQTSFLTPPFGFALFYLRGVAPKEITTGQIYKGILPFVAIQLVALGVLFHFSGLATWLPETLMQGP
ncbi:TRAP transporter large permease subunit [Roseovarius atlanticus]|uniref:TRAP transporter large permease n=1 Tax=Roseovarius atlanticus TaxID=1641875 RepID=UPI001C9595B3|nr:TRAP transporter large permease subunit [Roseovarius atlanticus]MBY5989121.1 TRAP transporter large permease subunit [Roseovarius atlanticus]MBY6124513.1 TRAP transporter large permease subunit [Roseovarius atlanticus]MBY6149008.1 TRAP transporter large permease subunit [Roseovarius atlanticus]